MLHPRLRFFMMKRVAQGALCAVTFASMASVAYAQQAPDEGGELSQTQFKYNEQGTAQSKDGRYEEAIASFKLALAIKDYNLLYLNLGRAYAKRGWCGQAKEAYGRVERAPALAVPTREEVNQVLKAFSAELDAACSAKIKLECEPATMRVSIAGADPIACDGAPVPVLPGAVEIVGVRGAERVEQLASAPQGEVTTVRLSLAAKAPDKPVDPTPPVDVKPVTEPVVVTPPIQPIPEPASPLRPKIGMSMALTGVAFLGTALLVDQALIGPMLDDLDDPPLEWDEVDYEYALQDTQDLQFVNKVLLVSGSLLTVTGLALWFWPTSNEQPAQGLKLHVGPTAVGVSASW